MDAVLRGGTGSVTSHHSPVVFSKSVLMWPLETMICLWALLQVMGNGMRKEEKTVMMVKQKRSEWKGRGRKGGNCKRGQTNIMHV